MAAQVHGVEDMAEHVLLLHRGAAIGVGGGLVPAAEAAQAVGRLPGPDIADGGCGPHGVITEGDLAYHAALDVIVGPLDIGGAVMGVPVPDALAEHVIGIIFGLAARASHLGQAAHRVIVHCGGAIDLVGHPAQVAEPVIAPLEDAAIGMPFPCDQRLGGAIAGSGEKPARRAVPVGILHADRTAGEVVIIIIGGVGPIAVIIFGGDLDRRALDHRRAAHAVIGVAGLVAARVPLPGDLAERVVAAGDG